MVTIDFGCTYDGFCSDMTRTISAGKPNDELKKIYGIVHEAQLRAIDKASAKVYIQTTDSIARDMISAKGFGDKLGHVLRHGLGIDAHEMFECQSQRNEMELKENYVITIEPGIYIDKNWVVSWIEDDVVIKSDTCEISNRSPKELIIL